MARTTTKNRDGAPFRVEPSALGDATLRATWTATADGLTTLPAALAQLIEFRHGVADDSLRDQDALWIEARLEEQVAVLRFDGLTNDEIRTRTLLGESTRDVCRRVIEQAEAASDDPRELERITKDFRDRYKPPVMMAASFMRTESVLAELLMKARTLDWYDTSIEDLRAERGVVVHKSGD